MRGGLQSPVDGWAVFEAVEPGSELLTFAGGAAYEARSPLRVLGKQTGALYLRVAQGVARTGEDHRETFADGRTVVGEAVKGTTGAVHAVAVWCGEGTPPPHPAINTWDVNFETRTSNATGDLAATWDDGRETNQNYPFQQFLKAAHPDDVLTMTRLVNRFVGAEPGMLLGMRWSVRRGEDGWTPLQSYGRFLVNDQGERLWRGHSVDLTDVDDVHVPMRSLVGTIWSGRDQQAAIVDLIDPYVIRWLHEGLPMIDWPEDGWLNSIIHSDDQQLPELKVDNLAQLPIEQSASVQIRLRGSEGGWVRTDVVVSPIEKPTEDAAPAIAIFTVAKKRG